MLTIKGIQCPPPTDNIITFDNRLVAGLDAVNDNDSVRIKCGEIVLIQNRQRIRFRCSMCGKEMQRLDTFLRHTLQNHLLLPDELEVEAVLSAATKAMENLDECVPEIKEPEKKHDAVESEEEEDEVDKEMSFHEVEMLEEMLEEPSNEMILKAYEIEQNKRYMNLYDDSYVGVELDKFSDTAYDELTECYDQEFVNSSIEAESDNIKIDFFKSPAEEEEIFEIEFLKDVKLDDEEEEADEPTLKIPPKEISLSSLNTCEICCRSFKSRVLLNRHSRRSHTATNNTAKPYACEHCSSTFKDSSNLKVHRYRHLGIKPHQCALCEKAFISSSELKLHMRSHTGERPFQCSECGQAFTCSAHLTAHRRRHANDRPWVCSICGKGFYDRGQLREHARGHSDERPFACEQCGMSFTRRKSLVEHEKVHAEVKRYCCVICRKAFAQNAGLHAHMKKVHAVKR